MKRRGFEVEVHEGSDSIETLQSNWKGLKEKVIQMNLRTGDGDYMEVKSYTVEELIEIRLKIDRFFLGKSLGIFN